MGVDNKLTIAKTDTIWDVMILQVGSSNPLPYMLYLG